ncbi:putative nucleotide-binding protein [Bradyrhizobium sp. GM0.4]
MARRKAPAAPEDRSLSSAETRKGIERLDRRIQELKALDPQSVTTYRSPEIVALQTSIEDTLASIFGQETPKFYRYRAAANLEPFQTITVTSDWIGARGGHRGSTPHDDVRELQQGIAERRDRAIALIEQAVRSLSEECPADAPDESLLSELTAPSPQKNAIFVVHGHDGSALHAVARFLEQLQLQAIVLSEQPDGGRTIIEKFEHYAGEVGFAVVLLTPDDVAGTANSPASAMRARQNVIFELGYFAGKLGRGRTCLLRKGDVEIPSDLYGVIYKELDAGDGWKLQLVKELKAAELDFDANKMWQ